MRDELPKTLLLLEKIMELWISNTPKAIQPRWFWRMYYAWLEAA